MFIDDDDVITIKLYYKKIGRNYRCVPEKTFNRLKLEEEEKQKYKELDCTMKVLSWGLYNSMQESAMVDDGSGNRRFNYKLYKENRLRHVLKSWNAVDKDGKPAAIDNNSVVRLAPSIAESLLNTYDDLSFVDEEQEKN